MTLQIERGSTGSHSVENTLWKGLRTCRKADNSLSCTILISFKLLP